jgi:hypothetical protein
MIFSLSILTELEMLKFDILSKHDWSKAIANYKYM